jgi:TolB-like protein/class 3 adenylate cyclase
MADRSPGLNVPERRLVAIMAADIAGYSRLMGNDEAATIRELKAHQAAVLPMVKTYGGSIVDTAGDGILAEFASAIRAVECAMAIQQTMSDRNRHVAADRRMLFRIGVTLGDIIHDRTHIYGEGVNVAARLEELAEVGGICLSSAAHDQVQGKLDCTFELIGDRTLKNIARPVRVYRVIAAALSEPLESSEPSLPDWPSIAVLPFDNMSVDPSQQFFSDGITEDITTALSKLKGFLVIARNTMFTFKGKAVDVRAVGRELGVRYVLEGSVRTARDRIRVTAQLIDATSGSHLWGEHYDRRLDDIFAIQDEITTSVVGRIGPELWAAEHARMSRKLPQNLDAWECTIGALFQCGRLSEDGSQQALKLLDRAVRCDPDYAQALGLKAWITVWRAFQGWEDMGQVLAEVRPMIARALAADAEEPWPYLAQAMVGFATRDNALSMAGTMRAVQLNPNFAQAHGLMGVAHAFGGRAEEALACIDHAVRLSPREVFHGDFHLYYAFAHFQASRYELGLHYAQQAHHLRPGHPYPIVIGAAYAGHLGDARTATALMRDLKAIVPTISTAWLEMTTAYERPEDRNRLIEGLARAGLT